MLSRGASRPRRGWISGARRPLRRELGSQPIVAATAQLGECPRVGDQVRGEPLAAVRVGEQREEVRGNRVKDGRAAE